MQAAATFADTQIGSFIYAVSNQARDGLVKIDTTSFKLLKTIPLPNASSPYVLGADPTQTYVFVERESPLQAASKRTVDVISTASDTITRTVTLPLPAGYVGRISELNFSPDGSKAFVSLTDNNSVLVLSGDLTRQLALINSGGTTPWKGTLSPDSAWLYVPNFSVQAIGVVNTASSVLQGTQPMRNGSSNMTNGSPQRIIVGPDGTLYVSIYGPYSSGYFGELLVLQPNFAHDGFTLVKHLYFPSTTSGALQLTADGTKLYVLGTPPSGMTLYMIDTGTFAVTSKPMPGLLASANFSITRDGNRVIVGQPYASTGSWSIGSLDPASDVISATAAWKSTGHEYLSFTVVDTHRCP